VVALSVVCGLVACSGQQADVGGLTAGSSCKAYLTATKDAQDAAVKQIAVAQHDSSVLTPAGRPGVDTYCGNDDGLTLGGAIAHAGASPSTGSSGASTGESSQSQSGQASAQPPAPSVITSTATIAVPQGSTGPSDLRAAFYAAVPVNPNPYMGAHPNVYFVSPSQNIGCYIFDEFGNNVECTIASYNFSQPGPDCPGGATVSIYDGGSPSIPTCATTSLYPDSTSVLYYGQSVTNGNLGCVSASTGVSCLDLTTGAGFALSRNLYLPVG
jgi:hypothetical protein